VIPIGEMRDAETAQTAMQAAESGHLVLDPAHDRCGSRSGGSSSSSAPEASAGAILAGVLRGVISQRLLPRLDRGRVPASR
jgi:Tfp pilus assembly pilus retraction ATPase PilT